MTMRAREQASFDADTVPVLYKRFMGESIYDVLEKITDYFREHEDSIAIWDITFEDLNDYSYTISLYFMEI